MKKWEYRILDSKDVAKRGLLKGRARADVEGYLNELGNEGWEIINLDFRELGTRAEFFGVAKKEITA